MWNLFIGAVLGCILGIVVIGLLSANRVDERPNSTIIKDPLPKTIRVGDIVTARLLGDEPDEPRHVFKVENDDGIWWFRESPNTRFSRDFVYDVEIISEEE